MLNIYDILVFESVWFHSQLACLRALMDLIGRTPARRLDGDGPLFRFSPELMIRIIQEIVCKDDATLDTDVTAALIGEYADVYDDVRYFLVSGLPCA